MHIFSLKPMILSDKFMIDFTFYTFWRFKNCWEHTLRGKFWGQKIWCSPRLAKNRWKLTVNVSCSMSKIKTTPVEKVRTRKFFKILILVRCGRLQTMFLYWENLFGNNLLMTNNDNCIRTLLNTSLASKSPKIFPMSHTRESLDIHIFTPFLSTQILRSTWGINRSFSR